MNTLRNVEMQLSHSSPHTDDEYRRLGGPSNNWFKQTSGAWLVGAPLAA